MLVSLVSVVLQIFKVHPGVVVADISDIHVMYGMCSYTFVLAVIVSVVV